MTKQEIINISVNNLSPFKLLTPYNGSFPLSGLFAWYDITDGTSLTLADAGTTVSQVNDKSGNGYNIPSGGEGTNPPYSGSGGAANKPYITPGGANYLQLTGIEASGTTYPYPYSFILVWRPHAGYTATQSRLLGFGVDGFGVEGLYVRPVSINGYADQVEIESYNGNSFSASPGLTYYIPNQWIITKVVFKGPGGIYSSIFNNRESDQNRINAPQEAGASLFNAVSMGGGQAFDISELLLFNTALTDDQLDQITNYLYLKYDIQDQDYSIAFGDSITFGTQSGTGLTGVGPYMAQARIGAGKRFYNWAYPSTQVPYNGGSIQFEDIFPYSLRYINNADKVHLQFGTNDALRNLTTSGAVAAWQAKYTSIIVSIINAGKQPSKILLATPPYNSASTNLGNAAQAVRNIAAQLGCTLVDFYQGMITAGLDTEFNGGDQIHPNGPISNFLATMFESFL